MSEILEKFPRLGLGYGLLTLFWGRGTFRFDLLAATTEKTYQAHLTELGEL